jgi:hypothetical protein
MARGRKPNWMIDIAQERMNIKIQQRVISVSDVYKHIWDVHSELIHKIHRYIKKLHINNKFKH